MKHRIQVGWVLWVIGLTTLILLGGSMPVNAQEKSTIGATSTIGLGKGGREVILPVTMEKSTGKLEEWAWTPKPIGSSRKGEPIKVEEVTLGLPWNDKLMTEQFNLNSITLKGESVAVQGSSDIKPFLESRGIEPDVNSRSIIYDLNPNIDRLDLIPPGTVLLLPKVEGDFLFENAKKEGYRVKLSQDGGPLKAINIVRAELKKSFHALAKVNFEQFGGPQDQKAIVNLLNNADRSLALISSGSFPVSQMVLKQSALEAEFLKNGVVKASGSTEKIGVAALEDINKTTKGLISRSDDIKEGGSGSGLVTVNTVKKVNGSVVHRLRVFFAPIFNRTNAAIFRTLTSPATEALPIGGTFTFWAAVGDKDPTPLSDEISITIKRGNSPITLLVK